MGALNQQSSAIYVLTAGCALAAWVLFGLAGHDPWKPDEAYTFGLLWHILERGEWLVPTLGGEPCVAQSCPPPAPALGSARACALGAHLALAPLLAFQGALRRVVLGEQLRPLHRLRGSWRRARPLALREEPRLVRAAGMAARGLVR